MAELETLQAECACCGDDCACSTAQPQDLPIACTLEPGQQAERVRAWQALIEASTLDAKVTDRGASLRLTAAAENEVRELIAAESRCCAFLAFDLRRNGEELVLSAEGPDEARPIILGLFGL